MSEDITFCGYDCSNMKCERNRKNIKMYWLDHSFAYFPECKYREDTWFDECYPCINCEKEICYGCKFNKENPDESSN